MSATKSISLALADLELVLFMLDSANTNNEITYGVYAEIHDVISLAMDHLDDKND